MENEIEQDVALEHQEEADLNTADETIDEVKARLQEAEDARLKAEKIAENQRIRAEKAERLAKGEKPRVEQKPTPTAGELTAKDIILLSKSNISESEDIDEVLDFAKYKGISISEALKSSTVKSILAEKAEQRKTAEVTNTNSSRRATPKITSEQIIAKSESGEDVDPEKLAEARMEQRKRK